MRHAPRRPRPPSVSEIDLDAKTADFGTLVEEAALYGTEVAFPYAGLDRVRKLTLGLDSVRLELFRDNASAAKL